MQTAITDPSRTYLVIGGGDGYVTKVVTGDKLEDAYLAMHFGEPDNCPADIREDFLVALRDADGHWEHNYYYGPVRYSEELEDGYVAVILMTPNVSGDFQSLEPKSGARSHSHLTQEKAKEFWKDARKYKLLHQGEGTVAQHAVEDHDNDN